MRRAKIHACQACSGSAPALRLTVSHWSNAACVHRSLPPGHVLSSVCSHPGGSARHSLKPQTTLASRCELWRQMFPLQLALGAGSNLGPGLRVTIPPQRKKPKHALRGGSGAPGAGVTTYSGKHPRSCTQTRDQDSQVGSSGQVPGAAGGLVCGEG